MFTTPSSSLPMLLYSDNSSADLAVTTAPIDKQGEAGMDMMADSNGLVLHAVLTYCVYPLLFVFGFLGNLLVITILTSSQFLNTDPPPPPTTPKSQMTSTAPNATDGANENASIKYRNAASSTNNSVVIRSVKSHFKKRSRSFKANMGPNGANIRDLNVTNFFLLNLAISDFIYIISIPFLVCTMHFKRWLFTSSMCKINFTLIYLCQFSTVFILVILSIDRYLAVKYPFRMSTIRTIRIARLIIAISWLLALLLITPVIMYAQLTHEEASNISYCGINWPRSFNKESNEEIPTATNETAIYSAPPENGAGAKTGTGNDEEHFQFYGNSRNSSVAYFLNKYFTPFHMFQLYTLFFNYLLPVGVIVVLYMKILSFLNKKSIVVKKSKSKIKSHRKITRMVLAIIICYLLSWTPYWLTQIYSYILFIWKDVTMTEGLMIASHLVQVGAYLSSALNPFIYSYMSEGFRTNFRVIIGKCFPKFSTPEDSPINRPRKSVDRSGSNRTTIRKEISNKGKYNIKKKNRHMEKCGKADEEASTPQQTKPNRLSSYASLETIVHDQNEVREPLNDKNIEFIDNEQEETDNNANEAPKTPKACSPASSPPKTSKYQAKKEGSKSNLAVIWHSIKLTKPNDDKQGSMRGRASPNRDCSNGQTNALMPKENEIGLENMAIEDKDENPNADVEYKYKTILVPFKPKSNYILAFNFHPISKLLNYRNCSFIKNEIKKNQYSTTSSSSNNQNGARSPTMLAASPSPARREANPIVSV